MSITTASPGTVLGGGWIDTSLHSISDLTKTMAFRAAAYTDDAAGTLHVQFYNLSDSTEVADLTQGPDSSIPVELSVALVPGTTAGFPVAKKYYEVRAWLTGAGVGAGVYVSQARVASIFTCTI